MHLLDASGCTLLFSLHSFTCTLLLLSIVHAQEHSIYYLVLLPLLMCAAELRKLLSSSSTISFLLSIIAIPCTMLNPGAPPFEYSPPPPPLPPPPPPLPPSPFAGYFLLYHLPRPFPCNYSFPPYFYPPPCLETCLVDPTAPPPPPPLPRELPPPLSNQLASEFSNLSIQQQSAMQMDQPCSKNISVEVIEHPDNTPVFRWPPATVNHYYKRKNLKPREKKRLIWLSHTESSGSRESDKQFKQLGVSLEFDEDSHSGVADQRTTVMIKNIPNKFSRDMLIELLDDHCAKENEKAHLVGSPSEYDFIYLPMDFKNECNLGYAFVNFTTAAAARRLYGALHRRKWKVFSSKKISHVCYARIQGKRDLVNNFRHSYFRCHTDEFFPAVLSPPRDGSTSFPAPMPVGRRYTGFLR